MYEPACEHFAARKEDNWRPRSHRQVTARDTGHFRVSPILQGHLTNDNPNLYSRPTIKASVYTNNQPIDNGVPRKQNESQKRTMRDISQVLDVKFASYEY